MTICSDAFKKVEHCTVKYSFHLVKSGTVQYFML